jgi:methyl-accepting chemotaxis protein
VAAYQETNATMQEVSQSCLQIAEKAKQVTATAEAVSIANTSSVDAVQKANQTVEAIHEQAEAVAQNIVSLSEKTQMVGDILATVNDIAEQSHLLALNAAIEAAAAGEHGRSFSVVAGEIKNLADQSKAATVQVKTILGDIQKEINTSVMLTEEAVKRVDWASTRRMWPPRQFAIWPPTSTRACRRFSRLWPAPTSNKSALRTSCKR